MGVGTVSNLGHAELSVDAYIAARAAIMSLTNSKGRPLNLIPDKLVVPPALESKARDILIADYINGTKNTMQAPPSPSSRRGWPGRIRRGICSAPTGPSSL